MSVQELQRLLRGKDIAGSTVSITVRRTSGQQLSVSLKRMATEEIADKRKMLELFTLLENFVEASTPDSSPALARDVDGLVSSGSKAEALLIVDEAIQLWSKMLLADAQHDDTIAVNITTVQVKSKALLAGLVQQVQVLPSQVAHTQQPVIQHYERGLQSLKQDQDRHITQFLQQQELEQQQHLQLSLQQEQHDSAASRAMHELTYIHKSIKAIQDSERQTLETRQHVILSVQRLKTLSVCFVAWTTSTHQHLYLKRVLSQMVIRNVGTTLLSWFMKWREFEQYEKRNVRLQRRSGLKHAYKQVATSFTVWHMCAQSQKMLFLRTRKIVMGWMRQVCFRALCTWKRGLEGQHNKLARDERHRVLQRAMLMRLLRRELAISVYTWRECMQQQRKVRLIARRVVLKLMYSGLSTALKTWHSNGLESRRLAHVVARVCGHMKSHLLNGAFTTWATHADASIRIQLLLINVEARTSHSAIGHALSRWQHLTHQHVVLTQKGTRILFKWIQANITAVLERFVSPFDFCIQTSQRHHVELPCLNASHPLTLKYTGGAKRQRTARSSEEQLLTSCAAGDSVL